MIDINYLLQKMASVSSLVIGETWKVGGTNKYLILIRLESNGILMKNWKMKMSFIGAWSYVSLWKIEIT